MNPSSYRPEPDRPDRHERIVGWGVWLILALALLSSLWQPAMARPAQAGSGADARNVHVTSAPVAARTDAATPVAATVQAAATVPAQVAWTESQVITPDGRLAYARAGRGPVLVVIPGGPGGSGWSLRAGFAPLAAEHTVVIVDNIGRGRSDRLADPRRYTVARDADDIERLRQELRVETVAVYGHSYGGLVAQHYALTRPDRVRRLVLGNTLHGARSWQAQIDNLNRWARDHHPEVWQRWMALRVGGTRSADPAVQDMVGAAYETPYWFDPENARRAGPRSADPRDAFNPQVYAAMLGDDPEWRVGGTLREVELLPKLKRITAPTLVLTGRVDPIGPPRVALEMQRALTNVRADLAIFERSGHRPYVEEPQAWKERVLAFLK